MFALCTIKFLTPSLLKRLDRDIFDAILNTDEFAIALVPIIISLTEANECSGSDECDLEVAPCEPLHLHDIHCKEQIISSDTASTPYSTNQSMSFHASTASAPVSKGEEEEPTAERRKMSFGPISIPKDITYVSTDAMNKIKITGHEGAEYTGNDAMDAEYRYFSVAMVVWKKKIVA